MRNNQVLSQATNLTVYYVVVHVWNKNIKHKYPTNPKDTMTYVKLMDLSMHFHRNIYLVVKG